MVGWVEKNPSTRPNLTHAPSCITWTRLYFGDEYFQVAVLLMFFFNPSFWTLLELQMIACLKSSNTSMLTLYFIPTLYLHSTKCICVIEQFPSIFMQKETACLLVVCSWILWNLYSYLLLLFLSYFSFQYIWIFHDGSSFYSVFVYCFYLGLWTSDGIVVFFCWDIGHCFYAFVW